MDENQQPTQNQTLQAVLDNMINIAVVITIVRDRNDKLVNAHFVEGLGLVSWTHVEDDLQLDIRRQPELTDPTTLEVACTLEKSGDTWVQSKQERSFTINVPEINGGQHAFGDIIPSSPGEFDMAATYGLAPDAAALSAAKDFSERMLRGFKAHESAI